MTDHYTPRSGSLAARLIAFFQENPDEELTRQDIAVKFIVQPSMIDAELNMAIDQGAIATKNGESMERVWVAGRRIKRVRVVKAQADDPRPRRRPASPAPDDMPLPSQIVIEKGVPKPKRALASEKYVDVFMRMEVDDSFAAPASCCKRLYEHARKFGKQVGRRFTLRRADDGSGRIWREE